LNLQQEKIIHLTELHQKLDDEIDKLNELKYLSQLENRQLKELKIYRLKLKDELDHLKNKK